MPASQPSPKPIDADFISASELLPHLPCSRGSLYTWSRCGQFPQPISFGIRKFRWRRSDVDAWLAARGLSPLPTVSE